jgi:hypothetical protein
MRRNHSSGQIDPVGVAVVTVFFSAKPMTPLSLQILKIDRSTPIVPETEQILNRRNSLLKSKAQISDGSGSRPWPYPEKFAPKISALRCLRMTEWE